MYYTIAPEPINNQFPTNFNLYLIPPPKFFNSYTEALQYFINLKKYNKIPFDHPAFHNFGFILLKVDLYENKTVNSLTS